MASYECIVQEGSIASALRAELAHELKRVAADALDAPGTHTVEFVTVPSGCGFTAGEVATASIIKVELPTGCAYETRKGLMRRICDVWYQMTACTSRDLVVFTTDQSLRE